MSDFVHRPEFPSAQENQRSQTTSFARKDTKPCASKSQGLRTDQILQVLGCWPCLILNWWCSLLQSEADGTWSSHEDKESPSPTWPDDNNHPGTYIFVFSSASFKLWQLGSSECSTEHSALSALASLGLPLFHQNVCSSLCCWCALANNWKTYFSISYLNFQNILVASWDEHCLFKMLKYRIIYVIKIKIQGADTIKNKEHFGYKGWLEIESFQWRCCTADYLWARAVATCLKEKKRGNCSMYMHRKSLINTTFFNNTHILKK